MKLALIGRGIGYSLSPFIHNHWLKRYQILGSYELCPCDKLDKKDLLRLNFDGFNITMPFKKEIVTYLDEKDTLVQKIGAVNTVSFTNGIFKGTNTDATGFKRLLQPYLPLKSAVVLGGGGAALSTIWALAESGVEDIRAVVRDENFSLNGFNVTIYPWSKMNEATKDCRIFVNATPCGMGGNFSPLAIPALPAYCLVVDWVYHPYKTILLSEAEKRGHSTIDGLELLLTQAKDAFHFWFGIDPEITTELRRELCKLLD